MLREKNAHLPPTQAEAIDNARSTGDNFSAPPRKNLAQFLMESPSPGRIWNWKDSRITVGPLNCERVSARFQRALPIRPERHSPTRMKRWMESAHPDTLFMSVLSIGEIRKEIELLGPAKKRS